MNIYATFSDPKLAAEFMDDYMVEKMIAETAHILSSAAMKNMHPDLCFSEKMMNFERRAIAKNLGIPAPVKLFHPVVLWASESSGNYQWLCEHLQYLFFEYEKANKRFHSLQKEMALANLVELKKFVPKGKITPFINYAKADYGNLDFTGIKDTHAAYKTFLKEIWASSSKKRTWTNRNPQL